MSISLMHYFYTQICAVNNIRPSIDYTTLRVNYGLVKVESIQIECHCRQIQRSKPDTYYRPSCKKEVQRTGVVKRRVLEDQSTEITVCGYDIISFFLLAKSVSCISRFVFRSFTDQRGRYKRSVHCAEQGSAKYACYIQHVKRMHQDILFRLEYNHKVESTRDTQRHVFQERTWIHRVNQKKVAASATGADYARVIHGRIPRQNDSFYFRPIQQHMPIQKCQTTSW